jgi:hypothetical protein
MHRAPGMGRFLEIFRRRGALRAPRRFLESMNRGEDVESAQGFAPENLVAVAPVIVPTFALSLT